MFYIDFNIFAIGQGFGDDDKKHALIYKFTEVAI